jgi:hypothetical protein
MIGSKQRIKTTILQLFSLFPSHCLGLAFFLSLISEEINMLTEVWKQSYDVEYLPQARDLFKKNRYLFIIYKRLQFCG